MICLIGIHITSTCFHGEFSRIEGDWKIVLIILDLIGFLFFDMVYVAAVMNYAAQSEMNIYLLSAIRKLVQDKSYGEAGLDGSIKVYRWGGQWWLEPYQVG